MVFDTTRIRLTRTSSDLRTLSAALLPPSPILKADDLLPRSISGEIPIFFEATTPLCESPARPRNPPGLWNLGEEITYRADTTANTWNVISGDEALPENWMAVESNEGCISAKLSKGRHAVSPSDSFLAWAIVCKLKSVSRRACHDFPGGDSVHPNTQDACLLQTLEKQSSFEGLRDSRASYPNTTAFSSTPVVPKEDLDADQLPIVATFHTYSPLPTPTFAPPSPSPSTDVISPSSSPTGRQRHRRPLERAGAVRLPGRPRSPRLQVNETEAHSPTKQTYPRRQLADTAPMASTSPCTTDVVLPLLKRVALPDELSWLQCMEIELWFDQEGFRAARSCMQLIGYSPRTRSLYPYEPARDVESNVTAGVAEFMPTKRETFAYHYSTLDSSPTLRMISVAGDESRDYISKQAALSVKTNGVYTVLGTETPIASVPTNDAHGLRLHNVRLRWKFDYLVSDRKVDGTGKTLPGEKTLTPLTFSCSPYLFHPLQGKKAGLMYIMKKNLVPKLGSRKVEPPPYSPSRAILPRTPRLPSTGREVATHARCHSDALVKGDHYLLAQSPLLDTGVGRGAIPMDRVQRTRRRRASSAGENSLTCLRNDSPTGYRGIDSGYHA